MKIKFLSSLLIIGSLISLVGCKEHENIDGRAIFTDVVTLEAANNDGATMTFRKEGDSPLITLTTTVRFNTNTFKEGSRIMIQYRNNSNMQYTSGPVEVVAATNIEGSGAPALWSTATATNNWASSPVTTRMVQRSGQYLNLEFDAITNGAPKSCSLFIDSDTKDSECPHLHLVFDASEGTSAKTYNVVGSWDIFNVWNAVTTKSIRVYMPDPDMNPAYITITKE